MAKKRIERSLFRLGAVGNGCGCRSAGAALLSREQCWHAFPALDERPPSRRICPRAYDVLRSSD